MNILDFYTSFTASGHCIKILLHIYSGTLLTSYVLVWELIAQ